MFHMSFPNVKTIEDLAFFIEMKMRSMPEVSFKVNKWDPATGSKGALDVTWFRIKGIPYEKDHILMFVWLPPRWDYHLKWTEKI